MSVLDANSNFNYRWTFKDYPKNQHNLKVFSTFACGGGSTMGYKLAGYDVIGSNDIDPQLAEVYKVNHHPKYQYICPIKDLATIDLPKELFDLDILDGSPPCSTFSTAGLREKAWGKDKHFREGQTTQILDDLFFDFLDVAELLQPKVIVAENVSGMLKGNAKGYLLLIFDRLKTMGYTPQIFLLDASTMGVPQRRQRVFIILFVVFVVLPLLMHLKEIFVVYIP
jgi:DNA (cytosine-5)-methyltransferase 1